MNMSKLPKILCAGSKDRHPAGFGNFLTRQGCEVIFAGSACDLFRQAQDRLPDVILIDTTMSCINSLNLLKKVHTDKKTRYIPVLAVVPRGEKECPVSLQCDDLLASPYEMAELVSRIKLLMKLGYYRKQLNAREKFDAVVSHMTEGIVICDLDWQLQRLNISAGKHLNLSGKNQINILDYIYDNFSVSVTRKKLLPLTKPTVHFEIMREETRNTKVLVLQIACDMITAAGGEATGILLTMLDITGSKKEETLKHNFLSFISHKLRTPLTVLFARCDLIRSGIFGSLNQKQLEEMNALMNEIRHLRLLFNKLLNFVEYQKDTGENIKLYGFLESFFKKLLNNYVHRRIEVKTDIKDENLSVLMSRRKVCDIFENLMENAIKFNGKENVFIVVSAAKASDGFVNISFSDNGRGIPSEEYDRIFEKFYQVEKTFTGEMEGVGIGLSHVKKIIEDAGGTIQVESKIDRGTTFMLRLPAGVTANRG